ncbi:MAG: methionine--tRNA ligase [Patescibacteria group bacterium]
MDTRRPFYVTTSIAYVNAPPHIGFALELVYADATARFRRMLGDDVFFLTGTDEHGTKVARKAEENGVTPKQFADEMSVLYRTLAKNLNTTISDFYRTTDVRHVKPVEEFWKRAVANGYIYKKAYKGLYCIGCEAFKTEKELVEGKCPDHHTVPEYFEEENYFFALSAFRERLLAMYGDRPDFVVPEAKFNEIKQLVDEGLEDISVSRSKLQLEWGITVPDDPTQVIYVWFDALINYVSAIGFGSDEKNFDRFWPSATHIIGKEINRFHTALWPAMLMAADVPVPHQVCVHGWIHVDGQKMSKTLGNVINPNDLLAKYGTDATRYLLLSQIPFSSDGDWNKERSDQKYLSDLANDLGNLVYRVTSMLHKYRGGIVPAATKGERPLAWEELAQHMSMLRFDLALESIWKTVRDANQYVDQTKPWTLAKEGKDAELDATLYHLMETVRQVAWMVRPFMPEASDKMLDQLSQGAERENFSIDDVSAWGSLTQGTKVSVGEPLFPRLEDGVK